jgi:periplasmic divalent cation tolerance protein
MTEARVVLVTVPDRVEALRIVRLLVEERLVACGNVLPGITSIFRWEDELREQTEHLLVLKSDMSRIPLLLSRIPEVHPYEVPEILVLEVESGHSPYLQWITAETHERRLEEL